MQALLQTDMENVMQEERQRAEGHWTGEGPQILICKSNRECQTPYQAGFLAALPFTNCKEVVLDTPKENQVTGISMFCSLGKLPMLDLGFQAGI